MLPRAVNLTVDWEKSTQQSRKRSSSRGSSRSKQQPANRRRTNDGGSSSPDAPTTREGSGANSATLQETPATTPNHLTNAQLTTTLNPEHDSHEKGNRVTPSSNNIAQMKAVVELSCEVGRNDSLKDWVRGQVKSVIWSRMKVPNFNSFGGKCLKTYLQRGLGMADEEFECLWLGTGTSGSCGLMSFVNKELREQRGYAVQKMKIRYYGETNLTQQHMSMVQRIVNKLITTYSHFLLTAQKQLIDSINDDNHPAKKINYTRTDFLQFHVSSIQSKGNTDTYLRLREAEQKRVSLGDDEGVSEPLEAETWSQWKDYPMFEEVGVTSEKGCALLAWLIKTFGVAVCYTKYKQAGDETGDLFQQMTLDDLVFLFIMLQNNINKWALVRKAHQLGLVPEWNNKTIEEIDVSFKGNKLSDSSKVLVKSCDTKGYEYPNGAGIKSRDAKARYSEITKLFNEAFYNARSQNREQNRAALLKALAELEEILPSEEDDSEEGSHAPILQKQPRVNEPLDNELAEIHKETWGDLVNLFDNNPMAELVTQV